MRFRATVERTGPVTTGIEVPGEVVAALGAGRRPAVRATINGYTYRSSVAAMGGRHLLSVSAEVRARAGVAGGEEVDVDLELDTEVREVTVPADLALALEGDEQAKAFFGGLSYSLRLRHVLAIEAAKAPETRRRRIDKAVAQFHEGRA